MDTVPGNRIVDKVNQKVAFNPIFWRDPKMTNIYTNKLGFVLIQVSSQSTISRFACRILANRDENDLSARIYAAGFDSSRNIFLGKIIFVSCCYSLGIINH